MPPMRPPATVTDSGLQFIGPADICPSTRRHPGRRTVPFLCSERAYAEISQRFAPLCDSHHAVRQMLSPRWMATARRLRLVARPPSSTVEDRWFAALDGHLVRVETAVCPLTVLGIHRGARDVW